MYRFQVIKILFYSFLLIYSMLIISSYQKAFSFMAVCTKLKHQWQFVQIILMRDFLIISRFPALQQWSVSMRQCALYSHSISMRWL